MKVVLELLDQPSNIRKITVRHDIVIGRGADCNLRLSAPQISRRHCFLRVRGDSVSVTDLDSSNGTYLNGRRIESGKRFDIEDGITLGLGPIRFGLSVRCEQVSQDVLQTTLDESVSVDPQPAPGSRSTVIEVERQQLPQVDPLNLALEQGGPASDENEPTADLSNEVVDSEAEIVDLGRRIHEFELRQERQKLDNSEVDHKFAPDKIRQRRVDIPDDAELLD